MINKCTFSNELVSAVCKRLILRFYSCYHALFDIKPYVFYILSLWMDEILFMATCRRRRFIISRLNFPQQFLKLNFYYESIIYTSNWRLRHACLWAHLQLSDSVVYSLAFSGVSHRAESIITNSAEGDRVAPIRERAAPSLPATTMLHLKHLLGWQSFEHGQIIEMLKWLSEGFYQECEYFSSQFMEGVFSYTEMNL